MELFEQIRREYEFGVGTIQGVSRKLGVHIKLWQMIGRGTRNQQTCKYLDRSSKRRKRWRKRISVFLHLTGSVGVEGAIEEGGEEGRLS